MRIAALYDIHGNLPALEAVLREVSNEAVDVIVVGGDVLPGPMPQECLACLQNLETEVHFIVGNGETDVLTKIAGDDISHIPEQFHEIMVWTGAQLDEHWRDVVASWPAQVTLSVDGVGDTLFCHATPRNNTEIFTRLTPMEILEPVFHQIHTPLVICGHTHMQFDRLVGRVRVVNAGSVGMPFGEPGAYWLLLGPGIQLRHTTYDFETAAQRVRATCYPMAGDFAANHIVSPPSETAILERFRQAELK